GGEVVVDELHRVVLRHQRDGRRLALGRGQLIQGLRRPRRPALGQVRRGEGLAAQRRIEEPVEQYVVAAVGDDRRPGHGGGVRLAELCRSPGRGEQVLRGYVVALVLVNDGEGPRRRARSAGLPRGSRRGHG